MSSYPAYPYDDGLLLDEQQAVAVDAPRVADARVERWLGAVVVGFVGLLFAVMVVVFVHGWPSFAHNGLAWFSSGGNVEQELNEISQSAESGAGYVYTFHAWP